MKKLYSLIGVSFLGIATCFAQTGSGTVSLTTIGVAATENFDGLSNTAGSTTNTTLPTGWYITESGGGARDNEQYAVDIGSSTTGDTYSYGAGAATDRALGELRSGTLIPLFGASFTNNTGSTITSLNVAYTGEEWRLGIVGRPTPDQLNFEISTNSTDLLTGTYTGVAALNFVSPDNAGAVGARNGNAAADRTLITATISSLSIPNGATFWIRWTDLDVTGVDDGIAVDDFSITPQAGVVAVTGVNLTAVKNNSGSLIRWTTEQEVNSSSFIVQRSADGSNWQNIARVTAAGNSNTRLNYSAQDAHPLKGNNWYRLQMLSMDNKISYSNSYRLNFDTDIPCSVYPNPAKNVIWVTTEPGVSTGLQVINASGSVEIQKQVLTTTDPVSINVETLKPGMYWVRVSTPAGKPSLLSFIKQ